MSGAVPSAQIDITKLARRLARQDGGAEANLQADVQTLLLYGGLDLGEQDLNVELEAQVGAFGYVGLIDGEPAPVMAAIRERTLLLAVRRTQFDVLFYGSTIGSYAFFEAVQRDLMTALRQADRPQARLASAAL